LQTGLHVSLAGIYGGSAVAALLLAALAFVIAGRKVA
jgi:hypothetical protein